MIKLYPHQELSLLQTRNKHRVAYYLDMGLGKTFVASEKANEMGRPVLVVCQKSKIKDWVDHFQQNYDLPVTVINYELIWRRTEHLNWAGIHFDS